MDTPERADALHAWLAVRRTLVAARATGNEECITTAEKRARAAKSRLLAANMGLVTLCARRWQGNGLDLDDLFQEACIGFCRAADIFDPSDGRAQFSTFATASMSRAVGRAIDETARAVRIPCNLLVDRRKLARARIAFAKEHGRWPTDEEAAKAAGIPTRRVPKLDSAERRVLSLDAPLPFVGPGEGSFADILPDEAEMQDQLLVEADARDAARAVLGALPERSAAILRCRLGFGRRELKLREVAAMLGLSKERVRQIQVATLRRLLLAPESWALRAALW